MSRRNERSTESAEKKINKRSAETRAKFEAKVRVWPAAGFVDTEIRCLTELEIGNAKKEVQSRVQA